MDRQNVNAVELQNRLGVADFKLPGLKIRFTVSCFHYIITNRFF